jgi:hypothetical protein
MMNELKQIMYYGIYLCIHLDCLLMRCTALSHIGVVLLVQGHNAAVVVCIEGNHSTPITLIPLLTVLLQFVFPLTQLSLQVTQLYHIY